MSNFAKCPYCEQTTGEHARNCPLHPSNMEPVIFHGPVFSCQNCAKLQSERDEAVKCLVEVVGAWATKIDNSNRRFSAPLSSPLEVAMVTLTRLGLMREVEGGWEMVKE